MRVGVLATVQHSMFSSGLANTSLAIAELFRELGHEVELIQALKEKRTWWDDCQDLAAHWKVVPVEEATGYDLLIESDRMMLTPEMRKRVATTAVWLIRHPFLLSELESSLFPTATTPIRRFEGLREVWMFDSAAEAEEGAVQVVELLSGLPVRILPHVWSPNVAAAHLRSFGQPNWAGLTAAAEAEGKKREWAVHITETNTTNASACVLPLVILREAKRRGLPISTFFAHNTDQIKQSKFFRENTLRHCTDAAVGLSGECVGRVRCVEWARHPFSCVVSHMRFRTIRTALLDLAWAGVPTVHNSPRLRDVGYGLEKLYYSGNRVGQACEALEQLHALDLSGAAAVLEKVRHALLARYSPISRFVQEGWKGVVAELSGAAPQPQPQPQTKAKASPRTFRVGFCDMWENFNPAYNFFTLMLATAGRALQPPVEVIGAPASPTDDLIIFGPFGSAWTQLPPTQPKVHFTGENTAPLDGPGVKLNLGFEYRDMTKEDYLRFPLWLLEIDWFGADVDRIANPKPIPLERCTKVNEAERTSRHKKFCAFVVSNPCNQVRNAAYHWLNDYKEVDSAGRLFNTMGDILFAGLGGGGGELKKFEFFKDYKFAITYENSSSRGYTTEKFLHAKAAGCIPIYWGDPVIERDFNLAGAIDARKLRTPEELVAAVRAVDEDDAEWERRFSVPALDSYKVEWCRRTMAECARRIFNLGGLDANSAPRFIEITPGAEKVVAAPAPAPVAAPVAAGPLELPILVTTVTRRFLPSLQHWLMSAASQKKVVDKLEAIIFLGADVEEDSLKALREAYPFVVFERLPSSAPPAGAEEFTDYWAPEHYAWKLWVYNELAHRESIAGRMVLYTDAGSFLCRWPKDWILAAQASDVCLLEDAREENARWCSPAFVKELEVTAAELQAQQRLGGLACFRAGSPRAKALFAAAYEWSKKRSVIAGEKWAGVNPSGKPYGHRHDQSILSILSLRQGVQVLPLDSVYCDVSLRKTFTSSRSVYVHRGNFTVHKKFTEGIDEAYVINLDRRTDRMERLWSNHPELQGRLERWSAVEGKKLRLTPALGRLLRPNDFLWKKAIAGCALSHLGLWWKLAHEPADIENYLILEDDVKFRGGWEDAWKAAVAREEVPEDYDILYLGGVLPPNRAGWEQTKDRVNASFVRVAENTRWGQQQPNRYFHFCAYAYVLSRRGAQKVLGLMEAHKGYWTSADHILCNPVTVLKSYVLDPEGRGAPAGCYQDDDPAYANAAFNDFTRVDSFDSDLWNNDERFAPGDVEEFAKEGEGPLPFAEALADARRGDETVIGREAHAKAAAALEKEMEPAAAPATAPKEPITPRVVTHPIRSLPSRLICLEDQALDFSKLYECDWLLDLFGRPALAPVDRVHPTAPPPWDCPIVIVQRPHTETIGAMLERWDSFGAKFKVLHLSDEYGTDPVDFYDLSGCVGVLRTYLRPDLAAHPKVLTVPLGFHYTLAEGSKNSLTLTPHLPFRETTWSFFGTGWAERRELLKPLLDLSGAGLTSRVRFFDQWNDSAQLAEADYISVLLDSVFVPCPDGNNPETFRFYEALECGAVPLLVRTERNAAWVDWVAGKLKLLPLKNWSEVANFIRDVYVRKPELAERYRETVLREWQQWKEELKREVGKWLALK